MFETSLLLSTVEIETWHPGSEDDLTAIAELISELGYPVDATAMSERLARIEVIRDVVPTDILLARIPATDDIVGLVFVTTLSMALELDPTAEIWALVVEPAQRGKRIGQQLVAAAENWARQQGLSGVRLRTNVARTDAHRFYERLGYEHLKTSRTYAKEL